MTDDEAMDRAQTRMSDREIRDRDHAIKAQVQVCVLDIAIIKRDLEYTRKDLNEMKEETVKIQKSVEKQAELIGELKTDLRVLMVKFGIAIAILTLLIEVTLKFIK